jgi:hypothetical protein
MEVNIRLGSVSLLMLALAGGGWFAYDKYFPKSSTTIDSSVIATETPVVMRTPGGLLEIATVKAYERFTRLDSKDFWGIPLGTTVSQIQVPVIYRFHIEMAKEWPIVIVGKTAIVKAGPVKPSLPVAFDTTAMQKYSTSGWARFNKDENLALLERSLTPELQTRAQSNQYRQLATEAGRQTVAEFVTTWLLKEQQWKRDPDYKVVVLFPGEASPPSPKPQAP